MSNDLSPEEHCIYCDQIVRKDIERYTTACSHDGLGIQHAFYQTCRDRMRARIAELERSEEGAIAHISELERELDKRRAPETRDFAGFKVVEDASLATGTFELRQSVPPQVETRDFQSRVRPWLHECFGAEVANNKIERNHRFIEEALELVQACGCTKEHAHQIVDYVYGRPTGDPFQEVGGVMVTLAALCLANELSLHNAAEGELRRVWTRIDVIREKQARKVKDLALPGASQPPTSVHPTYEQLLQFVDSIATYDRYTSDDVNLGTVLKQIEHRAIALLSPSPSVEPSGDQRGVSQGPLSLARTAAGAPGAESTAALRDASHETEGSHE